MFAEDQNLEDEEEEAPQGKGIKHSDPDEKKTYRILVLGEGGGNKEITPQKQKVEVNDPADSFLTTRMQNVESKPSVANNT